MSETTFAEQYQRVKNNINLAYNKIEEKGGTIPATKNSDNLPAAINSISGDELNVFAQLEEPETKDGVWIKTEEFINDIYTKLTDVPYGFMNGSAVAIGTDIYLFGSENSSYYTTAYKYDTLTDTYTKLTNIPYNFYYGSAAAIGTDIYLFGSDYSSSSRKTAYKYDTLTNTYTKLTNIPYIFWGASAVSVGTDVYLFGSADSNYRRSTYKYDTITNSYTSLTSIPYEFYYGRAAAIGTDVYLFKDNTAYKYDTLTDSYTQLANIPYSFGREGVAAIGTDIYLFSGGNARSYKYNTSSDTYIRLKDIPDDIEYGCAVGVNTYIYLFCRSLVDRFNQETVSEISKYKYDGIEINDIPPNEYMRLTDMHYNFESGSVTAIGTDIYIFGCGDYSAKYDSYYTYASKYDTSTDTYIGLNSIPYEFYYGGVAAIGTDIYLFGSGRSGYEKYAYKYNTSTNSYTKLTDIPYNFAGDVVAIDTNIYLFDGTNAYKYDTLTNSYTQLANIPSGFGRFRSSNRNRCIFIWRR